MVLHEMNRARLSTRRPHFNREQRRSKFPFVRYQHR